MEPGLTEIKDLEAALFLRGVPFCGFALPPARRALTVADHPGRVDKIEGRDITLEAFTTRITITGSRLSLLERSLLLS